MSAAIKPPLTGVVLMAYGSATTSADVETFLRHVYPNPSPQLIVEYKRRFDIVGSSPLIEITLRQAAALDATLASTRPDKHYRVLAGILHSQPFIGQAVTALKTAGATRILGLLLSPQYSPHVMGAYDVALTLAGQAGTYQPDRVRMVGDWGTEPKFVELLSSRIRRARLELERKYRQPAPVIFTTHSLPERVVKKDPEYLKQLQAPVDAVATLAGLIPGQWFTAYQSAGHTPEPWLIPDITDVITDVKQQNAKAVLIVPIQFLADDLKTLYDLDIAAADQAESLGICYRRLPVPGTDPLFIEALTDIVLRN